MTVPIRHAGLADVEALVHVINRAYQVESFFVDSERTNSEDVRGRIGESGRGFLVIDDEDTPSRLVGCVYVEVNGRRAYFGMLAIDPDWQGRGLGRALVTAAEMHGRGAGCDVLAITVVNLRTELFPLYARLGFVPTGRTLPFHTSEKLTRAAHLVEMVKPL